MKHEEALLRVLRRIRGMAEAVRGSGGSAGVQCVGNYKPIRLGELLDL